MIISKKDIKKEIEYVFLNILNKKVICNNLKKLPHSIKNINYYFKINNKEYIFRININGINNNSFKKSKQEYNSLKLLKKYLPYKKYSSFLYFSKKGKFISFSYIIINYLKGKQIKLNKNNIITIAKEIIKVNLVKLNLIDRLKIQKQDFKQLSKEFNLNNHIIQNIPSIYNIYLKIHSNLMNKAPKDINKDFCLIHGDLSIQNIIENKKEICFIDWEYLKLGNPLFDIAKLSHAKYFEKFENIFLKEYTKNISINNIYEKYLFCRDYQVYCWLVSSTKYYLENIFKDIKYKTKNQKDILNNIFNNYNYLYNKKYINKEYNLEYFKRCLKI